MGIEKHIDACMDGKEKIDSIKDPVDMITVAAMLVKKNKKGCAMNKERKFGCLSDQEIAAFIELKQKYKGYGRAVRHMADCDSCRRRALDSQELLSAAKATAPRQLVEKAFAEARAKTSSKSASALRSWKSLAAAAVIIVLVTAALYVVKRPGISVPEQIVALDRDLFLRMANNDAGFIRQNSPLFEKDIKALTGVSLKDLKLIHQKGKDAVFRQRRLVNAGYVFFLISNSHVTDILSDQIRLDLAVTDMDVSIPVNFLLEGKSSLFYKDIRGLSKADKKSFDAGYLLGQVFYADANNLLVEKIISIAEEELAAVPADGMREYIASLPAGAGDRTVLRERIKKSLLAI